MTHKRYHHLIIGGGMTAAAAAHALRERDANSSVAMISAESDPPYDRPPLTKGLWQDSEEDEIWRGVSDLDVDLYLGRRANVLEPDLKWVKDDQEDTYTYDHLLLATGGHPRQLPIDDGNLGIIYYRTLADYRHLAELSERHSRFAVIGGGFIGSELAASLAMKGKDVTLVFPEAGIGAGRFPSDLGRFLNQYYEDHGVRVLYGMLVVGIQRQGGVYRLHTDAEEEIEADVVVAGLGIEPNVQLAEYAGLAVQDGILVDEFLRTSDPNIYAAGDVARFQDALLQKRRRVEHEDNALTAGAFAGRAMAGDLVPYEHSPFFYSDLFDLGYEAVGDLSPDLETVADWQERHRKGVVYYLDEGRVRGVLLWNVWDQVDAARELIAQPGPFTAEDLQGRLPGQS